MYRVQSFIAGDWHNIDRCFNEAQVIETMTVFSQKYHTYNNDKDKNNTYPSRGENP